MNGQGLTNKLLLIGCELVYMQLKTKHKCVPDEQFYPRRRPRPPPPPPSTPLPILFNFVVVVFVKNNPLHFFPFLDTNRYSFIKWRAMSSLLIAQQSVLGFLLKKKTFIMGRKQKNLSESHHCFDSSSQLTVANDSAPLHKDELSSPFTSFPTG